jgi:glucose-1-phosphate cytidylyltransferase
MSGTDQTQVVILCGGTGSRSYPFTEYYPKPMLPIVGTPILVHLMKVFASQGYRRFILAAGHRQEILLDYFRDRSLGWDVEIIDTGTDSGTVERIRRCAQKLNGRFMATYGDGVGNVNLRALLDDHNRAGSMATLTTVPLRSQYGTIEFDSLRKVRSFLDWRREESYTLTSIGDFGDPLTLPRIRRN